MSVVIVIRQDEWLHSIIVKKQQQRDYQIELNQITNAFLQIKQLAQTFNFLLLLNQKRHDLSLYAINKVNCITCQSDCLSFNKQSDIYNQTNRHFLIKQQQHFLILPNLQAIFNSDMDEYFISQQPSRFQAAHHFQSSLDEPNLENVEAKLYAIRQRNQEMAKGYFQEKYGSVNAYDQFLENSHLTDLTQNKLDWLQRQKDELDLKRHLEEKARQIEQQEIAKINKANGRDFVEKKRTSKKINPWSDKKPPSANTNSIPQTTSHHRKPTEESSHVLIKDDHEHEFQTDEQHGQGQVYTDSAVVNVRQTQEEKKGHFLNEFKRYLANKNHYQQQEKAVTEAKQPSLTDGDSPKKFANTMNSLAESKLLESSLGKSKMNRSLGKNESFLNKSGGVTNMENASSLSRKKTTEVTAEEQLVKKIFKSIQKGSPKHDYIEKIELAEYLTANERILSVIGISGSEVLDRVQNQMVTKDPHKVRAHECLMFVYQLLGKEEQQKKLLAKHGFNDIPDGCMLQSEVVKHFEKAFKSLDKSNDMIVRRLAYIEKLALDPVLRKILSMPAVYEPHIDKTVSVRRVFERIEVEALLGGEDSAAKQYISWAEFIGYFSSGHTERSKYDILGLVESLKGEDKFGFGNIPEVVFEVVGEVVKKVDTGSEYFNTKDLVAEILVSSLFEMEKYTFVRGKGQDVKSKDLPMETFEEVLVRIKETAPHYVSVKQFLEYFSDRGMPKQVYEQQIEQSIKKNNEVAKVSQLQNQVFGDQQHEIDGYDSDPEFYNNSKVQGRNQFRKTTYSKVQNLNPQNGSLIQHQKFDNLATDLTLKVTVPQPFKFQEREKRRMEQRQRSRLNRSASEAKSQLRDADAFRFKPKEIPAKVKEVGLFEKMMEENQKKTEDRRKCSMLLTLANEEPFSFYNRKANKKSHQQRKEYQFKANPIPWYCSVNLLKKKEEKNINRNEKIARMAQESLSKAKLPPRMEKDFQEKLAKKALQMSKKEKKDEHIIRAKEPPNFQVLHKRFENALQRKRKENKTTEVKQFNFRDAKREKVDKSAIKEIQKPQDAQKDPESWKKALKSSINVYASSTLKFDQQVQKRRQQMEQKKKKQQEKRAEEEERKRVDDELKKRLHSRSKVSEKKQESILEERKQEMKRNSENFKTTKAEWLKNAKKQPLLVERPLKRDIKIERMKKLHQISSSLKNNGIKGKDHNAYFNKEELLLLQDYQLLKDKL